ncbi:MAG: hypothetical protein HY737_06380 [Candidatus Omnitrophica bacterium]|nr:hypothetical protein [Candidatus Omnitrophota bacterium]
MARIGKVYTDLVRDLELKGELGELTIGPEVFGVVVLDSLESFVASPQKPNRVGDWFTAGEQIAPAANAVLADTGALAVGVYDVDVFITHNEPGSNRFVLQWRDAANAANLTLQTIRLAEQRSFIHFHLVLEIETANERFRVLVLAAGGAGVQYQASILTRAL